MNSEEVEKEQVSSGGVYRVDTHPLRQNNTF